MHAIINKKYIVHLHSISVLSYAILKNGKKLLESKLKGMKWIWIKYKKPGLNLAKEIEKKMSDDINIYILQNHGIIIASDTLTKINSLLKKIETKLKRKISFNLKKIKRNNFLIKNFKKPKDKIIEILALKKKSFEIIKNNNSLYPDNTVFLNNKIGAYNSINDFLKKKNKKNIIVIKNTGVFLKKNISKTEYDMLLCLAELLIVIPENFILSFLSKKEKNELINWKKEKIRQKFNKI